MQYECPQAKYFKSLLLDGNKNINRLLTEREGRTGEYWPEVVTVRKRPRANIPQYGSSKLG